MELTKYYYPEVTLPVGDMKVTFQGKLDSDLEVCNIRWANESFTPEENETIKAFATHENLTHHLIQKLWDD